MYFVREDSVKQLLNKYVELVVKSILIKNKSDIYYALPRLNPRDDW